MNLQAITPILNVSNLDDRLEWFIELGWKLMWKYGQPATFAAIANGKIQIFLCVNAQGGQDHSQPKFLGDEATGGVWMSWWVSTPQEVDDVYDLAVSLDVCVTWPPTDEPWGVRECRIRHPDGHTFRISSSLEC